MEELLRSIEDLPISGVDTKVLVKEALHPVQHQLDELESLLFDFLPLKSKTSHQVARHILASGGKRIRPALYFFCAELMGYKGEHLFPIAAVSEYVHTASLLHDDVVDSSSLRRNKPTANSIWGDQASVLVGDLIYSRASELMAATGSLRIVDSFARAIRLMSEGELLQLENCFHTDISRDAYFEILKCKTGALLAATCMAPAYLAEGESSEKAQSLERFGDCIGIAFQLIDDALDYLSQDQLFGKPTHHDIDEGKITLPLIFLRERCTEEEWNIASEILANPSLDRQRIYEWVAKYETAEATITTAEEYTDRAIEALTLAFPPSVGRERLITLANRLVWRFH